MDSFVVIKRDLNSENHCKTIPLDSPLPKGRKILILPGNGVNTPKSANGMCKQVENLLSDAAKADLNEEIYSAYYPNENTGKDAAGISTTQFFNTFFLPLISRETFGIKLRLSVDEAMTNMRNTVIVTHCYGSEVMANAERFLRKFMKSLGYSEQDRTKIMKQMFVLHANDLHYYFAKTKTTTLHRLSQSDETYLESKPYSLKEYIYTRKLNQDHFACLNVSGNESIFLFDETMAPMTEPKQEPTFFNDNAKAEHNQAFFNNDYNLYTKTGKLGSQVSNAVLNKVVTDKSPILPDIDTLIMESIADIPKLRDFITMGKAAGNKYLEEYNEHLHYFQKIQDYIRGCANTGKPIILPDNIEQKVLTDTDIRDNKTALEYVFDKGNETQFIQLWKKINLGRRYETTVFFEKAVSAKKYEITEGLAPYIELHSFLGISNSELPKAIHIIKDIPLDNQDIPDLIQLLERSTDISSETKRQAARKAIKDAFYQNLPIDVIFSQKQKLETEKSITAKYLLVDFDKQISLRIIKEQDTNKLACATLTLFRNYTDFQSRLSPVARNKISNTWRQLLGKDLELFAAQAANINENKIGYYAANHCYGRLLGYQKAKDVIEKIRYTSTENTADKTQPQKDFISMVQSTAKSNLPKDLLTRSLPQSKQTVLLLNQNSGRSIV